MNENIVTIIYNCFRSQQGISQADCKNIHTGNFRLKAFGHEVLIERTKTKEIVINKMGDEDKVFVPDILWINPCTYQTRNASVFKGHVPDEFKPSKTAVVTCEIVEVSEKYYKQRCLSNQECYLPGRLPPYDTIYVIH